MSIIQYALCDYKLFIENNLNNKSLSLILY